MSLTTARRTNPKLGAYFGIFASLFVALFILALVFAQLGARADILTFVCLLVPLLLYAALGAATATLDPQECLASGRRVPAVYNGAVMGTAALGGVFVVSVTGLFFADGFDAWAFVIGGVAGLVCAGILFAPYIRKFGAHTLPSFIGRRLQSRLVRVVAAAVFLVPTFLLLVAELSLATWVARQLTGSNERWMLAALAGCVAVCLLSGGIRSATWAGAAQTIALLMSVLMVVGLAGIWLTNLPVPQLSLGPTLQAVSALEASAAVPRGGQGPIHAAPFAFEITGNERAALTERLAEPFTSIGPTSFLITIATVLAGLAAAPWLLPRCATTQTVHAARKSLSWAVLVFALVMLTTSAAAVFLRVIVLQDIVGQGPGDLPDWFSELERTGLAAASTNLPQLPAAAVSVHRDAVLFALPAALGLSDIVTYLAYAGALAAALTAATATAQAMSSMLSEDVLLGMTWEPPRATLRMFLFRVAVAATLTLAVLTVSAATSDPLRMLLWALVLSAATAFPLTLLAIWYKRFTTISALAALSAGFATALVLVVAIENNVLALPVVSAGLAGVLTAIVAAFLTNQFVGRPARVAIEHVRDMRIPGGETIYDREMRLLRLRDSHDS
ncbi:MAG: sodium:solute symporter [Pseudomonadota bacterium]